MKNSIIQITFRTHVSPVTLTRFVKTNCSIPPHKNGGYAFRDLTEDWRKLLRAKGFAEILEGWDTITFNFPDIHHYYTLPQRVFNSPVIEYANFGGGSHVNLIRLIKPYANGDAYAIHDTKGNSELFKTYDKAKAKFDSLVHSRDEKLLETGITENFY